MNSHIEELAWFVDEYRAAHVVSARKHVKGWLEMFEEPDRVGEELAHVLRTSFLTRDQATKEIREWLADPKKVSKGLISWWDEATFLDIADRGGSQRAVLDLLDEAAAANGQPLPKVTSVLTLGEMAVTGIFKTPRGYAAMVEATPIKLSYTIYPGEKFFDGQLVAVEENQLVFRHVTKTGKDKFVSSVETKQLRKYTDQQVIDWMVARYGDFVRLRPPFDAVTLLLWAAPALALLTGATAVLLARRRRATPAAPLSPEERRKLGELLEP